MNPLRGFTNLLRCRCRKKIGVLQYSTENHSLKLNKVLVLNKASKLHVERLCYFGLGESDLKINLERRGLSYDYLVEEDRQHEEYIKKVIFTLKEFGVAVKRVNRFTCTKEDVEWCDAIFPVGGDGTFLHASKYIFDRNKPVIGLNSDPSKSVGYLCLPEKYSSDIPLLLKSLAEGKFKWMFRTRIRINIAGEIESPVDLHGLGQVNLTVKSKVIGRTKVEPSSKSVKDRKKLPILALNEVFMSEMFAAKVSYFEIHLEGLQQRVEVKSSGLCVSTGTGSTSWHSNLNRISRQDVKHILELYLRDTKTKVTDDFENSVTNVSNSFNEGIKFGPEETVLGYTIRDMISLGIWPRPKGVIKPRGFAKAMEVTSRCIDGGIIIDGGFSFPFNDGAIAYLETRPEDALRTVVLLD